MKIESILKVLALELGSSDLAELNKQLKTKASMATKYKIMGEKFGYIGLTVAIKNITPEGLKIFDVNKVRLVRFSEIETFEKAKPKVPRPVRPKKVIDPNAKKPAKNLFAVEKGDLVPEEPEIKMKKISRPKSNFIPAKKSR